MRVFIATTSGDLEAYRDVVRETVRELGWHDLTPRPADRPSIDTVEERERRASKADLVLALIGWKQGDMPPPDAGGDGKRSWTQWELYSAFRRAQPVIVLRADDSWPEELRETEPVNRAWVNDFRSELDRLAVPFDTEPADGPTFRATVRRELARHKESSWLSVSSRAVPPGLRLRTWPPPELPDRPYPLLLPYTHPDLLGGRDRELQDLVTLLRWPAPILGLHAPSGAGKSSLLAAGLVATLRALGRPVAFDRHPHEPRLAARLLGDLLDTESFGDLGEVDPATFTDRLLDVARLARKPPLLVLDQFEDVLRSETSVEGSSDDRHQARAMLGPLLAASVQRQPGFSGPPCRWLLAYRREYHGAVIAWLEDVLREARATDPATARGLPHDLSEPERFHSWALPPLGAPSPDSEDPLTEAAEIFQAAIEKPLTLQAASTTAGYPWRFAGDGATRLAAAFAAARRASPKAPLAPELQVVLAHLLNETADPLPGEVVEIRVPADSANIIDRALEHHLEKALAEAFPASGSGARRDRTRALLALRELADLSGKRSIGLLSETLARAIGSDGHQVLERLATPRTRLVVPIEGPEGRSYVLSHDRLAEVVVRAVEKDGRLAGLEVDTELLALRRFVALRSELFSSGEQATAIAEVPPASFQRIADNTEALLWGEARKRWWQACRVQHRADRRHRVLGWSAAAVILVLVGVMAWHWADHRAQRRALFEKVTGGEPDTAFAAFDQLAQLAEVVPQHLLDQLRKRESPSEILEKGLHGIAEEERAAAVLRTTQALLTLLIEQPDDPVLIANMVWALDFSPLREPLFHQTAQELRDQVLAPLRRARPPPLIKATDQGWVNIPGGTFLMGSGPDDARDHEAMVDEQPMHRVQVSAFRLLDHEVTNEEYRSFQPEHEGDDRLPTAISWYSAYTYAAWLGGRLPTESEWEYAARAQCPHAFCDHLGEETTIGAVAWWVDNSGDPESHEPVLQAVRQLEPNPWGLFDMLGNQWEWTADWYGDYPDSPQSDPVGPPAGDFRTHRGNFYGETLLWVQTRARGGTVPTKKRGFRVLLPAVD